MRFGLKVKEAFAVTLITFLAVTAATLLHLSELSRVELQEVIRQDELIAKQIYAQSSRALARGPRTPPLTALRRDQELRTLIEASALILWPRGAPGRVAIGRARSEWLAMTEACFVAG